MKTFLLLCMGLNLVRLPAAMEKAAETNFLCLLMLTAPRHKRTVFSSLGRFYLYASCVSGDSA